MDVTARIATLDLAETFVISRESHDTAEVVANVKRREGGNIAVLGSGVLVQTLIAHGLVDELFLVVDPLVLGGGKRLFRELAAPLKLSLVDSKPTTTGAVMLTYRADQRAA